MRITAAEQALLQTVPQRTNWYLSVEAGVTVFTAQVDGNHAQGATTVLLKNVVGDTTEAIYGMTVSIHLALVNDRKVSALFIDYASGTLTLGPHSSNLNDNMYITVYSAMHLWRKDEPTWDGTQHIKPFAIMGPARAMFTDQQINFVGANSYSPIGRTLTSPVWHLFGDLQIVVGSLNALGTVNDPLIVSCQVPGEHFIRLKVEDSAGEVTRGIRPVFVHSRTGENAPYSNVRVNSARGSDTAGWTVNFTVFGTADRDAFPPQARIVLWAEDWYGDTKQSIGGALRGMGEVIFDGWVRGASVRVSFEENSVTFDADSIDFHIKRLAMPDFTFRNVDDTTSWHKFSDLTVAKAALHIIEHHTTLPRMADVFSATFQYQLDKLEVPQADLHSQLSQSILQACFGHVAGSRFGSITLARDKNAGMLNDRQKLKRPSIVLTKKDWMDFTFQEERLGGSSMVVLAGRLGDDTPVRAQDPINGPAQSGPVTEITGLLFKTVEQAADMAGLIQRRDARIIKGVTLALPNYRIMEPAFQETFVIYMPQADNPRGFNWVHESNGLYGKEFFVTEMELVMKDNYVLVNLTGEASIYGQDGVGWIEQSENPPVLEDVPGYDQNPTSGATGID